MNRPSPLAGLGSLFLLGGLSALPLLSGCGSTTAPATGDLALDLKHVDPRVRIQAARAAAEAGRTDLLDEISGGLSDEDPAVRMFADVALRKLTGEDLDFKPHGTAAEREAGRARWVRWIAAAKAQARLAEEKDGQVSKQ